jgi:hypothetical protein
MEDARFIAILITLFVSVLVAFSCAFISALESSGERQKPARDKRMAEHQMAARLLRLNF